MHPKDMGCSFITALNRIVTGRLPELPWISQPAIRYLCGRIDGLDVFEFGGGMSTRWYAKFANRVVTVEDNLEWAQRIKALTTDMPNVRVEFEPDQSLYVGALARQDHHFDVVVIDGSHRKECITSNLLLLRDVAMVLVDNTDADPALDRLIETEFRGFEIRRFPGYAPVQLHPNETVIISRAGNSTQTKR